MREVHGFVIFQMFEQTVTECLRDRNLQNAIMLWNIHVFRKMMVATLVKKEFPSISK